jgi:hypothetical protein
MLVGQSIMSYDRSMDVLAQLGDRLGDTILAEKALKEVANEISK